MKKILIKKTNNITEILEELGIPFPKHLTPREYIDVLERITTQMHTVSAHLHSVKLGKVSYLSKLRVSSIELQKLFFLFRAYSCLLFPPRGKKSLLKETRGKKSLLKEKNS